MDTLIKQILQPAVSRLGTAAATWLVANGMEHQDAVTVQTSLVALALVGVDFAVSAWMNRGGR
ncbi:hypothetical protein V6767_05910 [Martelella sp. FLE1502]